MTRFLPPVSSSCSVGSLCRALGHGLLGQRGGREGIAAALGLEVVFREKPGTAKHSKALKSKLGRFCLWKQRIQEPEASFRDGKAPRVSVHV